MKALYFESHGTADALIHGDIDTPVPAPGWALLKMRAASLNYLDVFTLRGMPGIKVTFPMVTGGDCVAEVVEVNGDAGGLEKGARVLVNPAHIDDRTGHFEMMGETRPGALAEYVTARVGQLIPIPETVSDADAASLPVAYATAYRMLVTRGRVAAGETMLVLGASGGVGTAAVLLAKLLGVHVTAAAGSPEKCQRLLDLGRALRAQEQAAAAAASQPTAESGDAITAAPIQTPPPEGSVALYTVQVATPDAASFDGAVSSVRGTPGVRATGIRSTAIGGTSVMTVSYSGSIGELADALRARGFTVRQGSNALAISR